MVAPQTRTSGAPLVHFHTTVVRESPLVALYETYAAGSCQESGNLSVQDHPDPLAHFHVRQLGAAADRQRAAPA